MTLYAWIVWDLVTVLILFVFVSGSAYRGFVHTVISFIGYFIAAAAAGYLSPVAAQLLYDAVVRDLIRLVLQNRLNNLLQDGMSATASFGELLPTALRGIALEAAGLSESLIGLEGNQLIQELIASLLEQPVLSILRAVLFFAVFGAILYLVRRLAWLFTGLYHVPVLGTINIFFGGVIGVLQGVLTLYLLAVALRLVITLTGDSLPWLNTALLDKTYVLRFFLHFGTT